jgi:hypothetical protein
VRNSIPVRPLPSKIFNRLLAVSDHLDAALHLRPFESVPYEERIILVVIRNQNNRRAPHNDKLTTTRKRKPATRPAKRKGYLFTDWLVVKES